MKTKQRFIALTFLAVGLVLCSERLVFAQAMDIPKPPSKIAQFATKTADTAQKKFDEISNSKLAKNVGQGIKKAKSGMQKAKAAMIYAQEKVAEVQAKIAQAKSLAERTAALGKKIAEDAKTVAAFPGETVKMVQSTTEEYTAKMKRLSDNMQQISAAAGIQSQDNEVKEQIAVAEAAAEKIQAAALSGAQLASGAMAANAIATKAATMAANLQTAAASGVTLSDGEMAANTAAMATNSQAAAVTGAQLAGGAMAANAVAANTAAQLASGAMATKGAVAGMAAMATNSQAAAVTGAQLAGGAMATNAIAANTAINKKASMVAGNVASVASETGQALTANRSRQAFSTAAVAEKAVAPAANLQAVAMSGAQLAGGAKAKAAMAEKVAAPAANLRATSTAKAAAVAEKAVAPAANLQAVAMSGAQLASGAKAKAAVAEKVAAPAANLRATSTAKATAIAEKVAAPAANLRATSAAKAKAAVKSVGKDKAIQLKNNSKAWQPTLRRNRFDKKIKEQQSYLLPSRGKISGNETLAFAQLGELGELGSSAVSPELVSSVANSAQEISDLQKDMEEAVENLMNNRNNAFNSLTNSVERDYDEMDNLKIEYEKLMGGNPKKKDKKENSSLMKAKNFLKPGQIPSLENIKEIGLNRLNERKNNIEATLSESLTVKAKTESKHEEATAPSELGDTMPGGTETKGVTTEAITLQTKMLKNYVDLIVLQLKSDIAMRMSRSKKYNLNNPDRDGSILDYCNYVYPAPSNLLDMVGEMKEGLEGAVGDVTGAVNDATGIAGQVTGAIDDAKETAGNIAGAGGEIAGTVNNAAGSLTGGQE